MTLRLKLVVALASLAGLATIAIGAYSYRTTAEQLDNEVDRSLQQALASIESRLGPGGRRVAIVDLVPPPRDGTTRDLERIFVQLIDDDGTVRASSAETVLPVSATDVRIADDASRVETTRDVWVDGEPFRQLTASVADGFAVQLARSTEEVDRVLRSIRNRTLVSVVVIVALATAAGWWIARRATRRLQDLTLTAEAVASTGRLDVPAPGGGDDEVGRLGSAFSAMLASLRRSRDAQARLVQDAGHELRTPLTSLRTNISVLRRTDELPPDVRAQILDELDTEARELSLLVDEIVELASDRRRDEPEVPVDLDELVHAAADRVARRTGREVDVEIVSREAVTGRPAAIERAIANLVDNAAKFSEPPSTVEVRVDGGTVEVLDRGIGIAETDLHRVFDRFYRAVDARSRPGSGLGLAIVRAVAEDHGGRVDAAPREGGGTRMSLVLPTDDERATLRR